jgi:hypothetical protein
MDTVVLLGCGSNRTRRLRVDGRETFDGQKVVGVDRVLSHEPDVLWDLNVTPWPIEDNSVSEIHAYEVLEHLGRQGDVQSFFDTFYECWRILKPFGCLAATVPKWNSMWAWGDPSHTRIINHGSLVFLDQTEYTKQVGVTPMSDFRDVWKGDFIRDPDEMWTMAATFAFIIRAVKPPRIKV